MILAGLLLLAVFSAYGPALNGGLLWDDEAHVTQQELRSVEGLTRIWTEPGAAQQYYPLLHTAFWLEHRLWGDAVVGYHAVNVMLHALAALLVVAIVRRLLAGEAQRDAGEAGRTRPENVHEWAAWLAGAVFALHPLCVESVAWISEQKNTLSAVFYLSAALVYLRFDAGRRWGCYAGATVLFAGALLTKTVTATLPAALLVVLWWQRGRLAWRRDVAPLIPWFVGGAGAGWMTAWMERTHIGAQGEDFGLSLIERGLLAGRALVFYFGKLLWPADLMFIYPRWDVDASVGWQWLFPACVVGMLTVLLARARQSRGALAGFLFFAGTLFPALGFFDVFPFLYSYVADHFAYLASLGVIVPLAVGFMRGREQLPGPWRRVASSATLGLLVVLTALTWRQSEQYRNVETLWRTTLARNPNASIAHNNLGEILAQRPGCEAEAMEHYAAAVRADPRNAPAHNNLGLMLAQLPGREVEAIAHYEEALRIRPGLIEARNNLGVLLARDPARRVEGIAFLREVVHAKPDSAEYRENLGVTLLQAGDADGAIAELSRAVDARPDSASLHNSLGVAFTQMPGREREALAQFAEAVRLEPDSAESRSNYGNALVAVPGREAEALRELETALRLRPGFPQARAGLEQLRSLVQAGRKD
jgi:tetratricopeptide (TPR) repeat protein